MENFPHLKAVKESALIFKIKKITPELFALYKKHVEKKYPDYFINDIQQNQLIQDIALSFAYALESLLGKKRDKQNISGYEESFIFGFVSSNLYCRWQERYIYPQTETYKKLMLLKSLMTYLKFDLYTTDKIQKLYEYYIQNNASGLVNTTPSKDKNVIFLKKLIKNKHKNNTDENFVITIVSYLETLILEKHYPAFDTIVTDNNFLDIKDFFTDGEIKKFIAFGKNNL